MKQVSEEAAAATDCAALRLLSLPAAAEASSAVKAADIQLPLLEAGSSQLGEAEEVEAAGPRWLTTADPEAAAQVW